MNLCLYLCLHMYILHLCLYMYEFPSSLLCFILQFSTPPVTSLSDFSSCRSHGLFSFMTSLLSTPDFSLFIFSSAFDDSVFPFYYSASCSLIFLPPCPFHVSLFLVLSSLFIFRLGFILYVPSSLPPLCPIFPPPPAPLPTHTHTSISPPSSLFPSTFSLNLWQNSQI